jgi:DNA-binding MurR/RpiR family transcriptional regulator
MGERQDQFVSTPRGTGRSDPRRHVSVLIKVRGVVPNLRPAERRVAEAVLADPAGISESSITAVARRCQTSETTVLRFCRAIGLAGYPELRIALARAAQFEEVDHRAGAPATSDIAATDTLADVVAKITHAAARAVTDTATALDLGVLQAAIDVITMAPRIDIYGVGPSALVGQHLHQKLHRIGLVSFLWAQGALAAASAGVLSPGDVAIGLSHTGTTIDTIDALRIAQHRGGTTISVTNYEMSPIAAVSDLLLTTAGRETTFSTGAMSSRIAQLTVVDCLFAGVAQRSYDRAIEALHRTDEVIQTRHAARV